LSDLCFGGDRQFKNLRDLNGKSLTIAADGSPVPQPGHRAVDVRRPGGTSLAAETRFFKYLRNQQFT
jgi:hypothetical protein